jgi:FtsX-like permease family protein
MHSLRQSVRHALRALARSPGATFVIIASLAAGHWCEHCCLQRRQCPADRATIVSMVVRQGMTLTLAGVAIGLIGAIALSRVMAALLFEVSVTDWATFTVVPALLTVSALLASYLPARRATHVDPVVALRDE